MVLSGCSIVGIDGSVLVNGSVDASRACGLRGLLVLLKNIDGLTMAHPEVKGGLTSQGIPQLHINQLNTRFIMNLDHLEGQQAPTIISGGVHHWMFNKLTSGKLLKKTKEWDEWHQAEWLQLDQYYSQAKGMFGDPTFVKDQVSHIVWIYMVKDLAARTRRSSFGTVFRRYSKSDNCSRNTVLA